MALWGRDDDLLSFAPAPTIFPAGASASPTGSTLALPVATSEVKKSKKALRVEADARLIAPYLRDAFTCTNPAEPTQGTWNDPWGVKLITMLYGQKKPNAGSYRDRLNEAKDYAIQHFNLDDFDNPEYDDDDE
jgi:hypothetical protein